MMYRPAVRHIERRLPHLRDLHAPGVDESADRQCRMAPGFQRAPVDDAARLEVNDTPLRAIGRSVRGRKLLHASVGVSLVAGCARVDSAAVFEPFDIELPPPAAIVTLESELIGQPSGLAVDAAGRVWIADPQSKRVIAIDSTGRLIITIGDEGDGPGEMRMPASLLAGDTLIRVVDAQHMRIQDYRPDGTWIADYTVASPFLGAGAISLDGRLVLPTLGRDSGLAIVRTLQDTASTGLGPAVTPPPAGFDFAGMKAAIAEGHVPDQFRNQATPAIGSNGSTWLLIQSESEIRRYDAGGRLLWSRALSVPEVEESRREFFRRNAEEKNPTRIYALITMSGIREIGPDAWVLMLGEAGRPTILYVLDAGTGVVRGRLRVATPAPRASVRCGCGAQEAVPRDSRRSLGPERRPERTRREGMASEIVHAGEPQADNGGSLMTIAQRRTTIALCLSGCVLLALALSLGCGRGESARDAAVERDSAGITIVENAAPRDEWHIESSPALRIGIVEGDSAYQFFRINFAGRLSDGRIVVANGGTGELRFFDGNGAFVTRVGRKGKGPGEFAAIGSVLLTPADTLIVHDPLNRRLTWIGPAATLVREQPLPGIGSGPVTVLGSPVPGIINLSISTPTYEISHPDFNYIRDTLTVVRAMPARVDTLLHGAGQESALWVRFANGRPAAMQKWSLPFEHPLLTAGSGAAILMGRSEAQQIEILDADARLTRIVRRRDRAAIPLTDQDREAYVRATVDAAHGGGQTGTAELEKGLRDVLAAVPADHTMPVFDRMLVDTEGRIWVRDYVRQGSDEPSHGWTVYDRTATCARTSRFRPESRSCTSAADT